MRRTDDLTGRPRLLLFAGLHASPKGGAGDLVGWFESEAEARAAFLELRASRGDDEGWAELVALTDAGPPVPVAWFGRPSADPRRRPAGRGVRRRHLRLLVR